MSIKIIDQLDIREKRVFVRVDFNVPMDKKSGRINDDTRIRAALPTINYVLENNARLILASHLGRPKGKNVPELSLLPVAEALSGLLSREVIFPDDCVGDGVRKIIKDMDPGNVVLLENLRFHSGEEKNDPAFASRLAALCEVYVNDAFGAAHRAHASTDGMVASVKEKAAGFLMQKELEYLGRLLESPDKPFMAILGGAKVSDKIGVIENLLNLVEALLICGGMAYTFLKAQGNEVGKSLLEADKVKMARRLLERAQTKGIEILLPVDHVVAPALEAGVQSGIVPQGGIPADKMALDIGPETIKLFTEKIKKAKTIFWNGPAGAFEIKPFNLGTEAVAKAVAESDATSVVGGGDSVSAINKTGVADKITHISTGGGASLEFMEGKKLPGIAALEE